MSTQQYPPPSCIPELISTYHHTTSRTRSLINHIHRSHVESLPLQGVGSLHLYLVPETLFGYSRLEAPIKWRGKGHSLLLEFSTWRDLSWRNIPGMSMLHSFFEEERWLRVLVTSRKKNSVVWLSPFEGFTQNLLPARSCFPLPFQTLVCVWATLFQEKPVGDQCGPLSGEKSVYSNYSSDYPWPKTNAKVLSPVIRLTFWSPSVWLLCFSMAFFFSFFF